MKLCMMITFFELYTLVSLALTLTCFQGGTMSGKSNWKLWFLDKIWYDFSLDFVCHDLHFMDKVVDKMLVFSHCSLRKVFETLQDCSTLEALQVHACSDDFDAFKVPGEFEKKWQLCLLVLSVSHQSVCTSRCSCSTTRGITCVTERTR